MSQDDLYSLDSSLLDTLKPIHALIFLFKYVGQSEGGETSGVEVDPSESGVWFANQVSPPSLPSSHHPIFLSNIVLRALLMG